MSYARDNIDTPDSSEQPYVTRDDLEWLRDVGIPAWLKEMAGDA